MKQFSSFFLLFATFFAISEIKTVKPLESVKAIVVADSLNVRAIANTRSEVLCQIIKNQEVAVFEVKENWARIQAPRNSIVWIQAENLQKGLIKHECSIYAGPAILYSVIGKLKIGNAVQVVRGSEKWIQIVPPKGIGAWVSDKYLKFPEITVEHRVEKPDLVEEIPLVKVDPKTDLEAKVAALKDNKKLIASLDPGDKQYYFDKKLANEKGHQLLTGTITKLKKPIANLASHALVIKVDKKYYTICYLRSTTYKLDEWVGKTVAVQGKEELIAGWQHSVIVAESIRPILGKPVFKMNEKK